MAQFHRLAMPPLRRRSEERRVGEEGRSRGAPQHLQKEAAKRDKLVTGVQTCALPISVTGFTPMPATTISHGTVSPFSNAAASTEIGRASCRGRGEISGGAAAFTKRGGKTR